MRYWWVNQNQTYKHEVGGGYLWSPKTRADGHNNPFYDTMARVQAGDIIFSFSDTYIKALGIAQGAASTAPKPAEFGKAGANWTATGWLVPAQFMELTIPLRPKDHIGALSPTLPSKYSPLQANGNGNQTVYLAEVPEGMAEVLLQLIGPEAAQLVKSASRGAEDAEEDRAEDVLRERADIEPTVKAQLIQARRGQGLFRARVQLLEACCRLTKVADAEHLRASHIKPWRVSTNHEKLDGANGLLLAPHIDHLFDRGFISFSDDGKVLVSSQLAASVKLAWGMANGDQAGPFRPEQLPYLAYHRSQVFRG